MSRVYIASPYGRRAGLTEAQCEKNVQTAIDAAIALIEFGHNPFTPHLLHYIHKRWRVDSPSEGKWMELCLEWLSKCDALVRLPGKSEGADNEVAEAKKLGIPVYFGLVTFLAMAHCGAKIGH